MKIAQSVSSRFAETGIAQGALVAFLIKLGGSSLNIVMFTIAARVIGPAEFGQFAIWFNLVSFLAVIALCGQETLIVRSWNEYTHQRRYDLVRGAISFGIVVCAAAALFWAGCVAVGSQRGRLGQLAGPRRRRLSVSDRADDGMFQLQPGTNRCRLFAWRELARSLAPRGDRRRVVAGSQPLSSSR